MQNLQLMQSVLKKNSFHLVPDFLVPSHSSDAGALPKPPLSILGSQVSLHVRLLILLPVWAYLNPLALRHSITSNIPAYEFLSAEGLLWGQQLFKHMQLLLFVFSAQHHLKSTVLFLSPWWLMFCHSVCGCSPVITLVCFIRTT